MKEVRRGRFFLCPWTQADDDQLRALLADEDDVRTIGIEMSRTIQAVRNRANRLKTLLKRPNGAK